LIYPQIEPVSCVSELISSLDFRACAIAENVRNFGRLLRYVEVDGGDVGLTLIMSGFAVAKYSSIDLEYKTDEHERESENRFPNRTTVELCPASNY
jgi:hypothetical protein